jgi:hypothetical protein
MNVMATLITYGADLGTMLASLAAVATLRLTLRRPRGKNRKAAGRRGTLLNRFVRRWCRARPDPQELVPSAADCGGRPPGLGRPVWCRGGSPTPGGVRPCRGLLPVPGVSQAGGVLGDGGLGRFSPSSSSVPSSSPARLVVAQASISRAEQHSFSVRPHDQLILVNLAIHVPHASLPFPASHLSPGQRLGAAGSRDWLRGRSHRTIR